MQKINQGSQVMGHWLIKVYYYPHAHYDYEKRLDMEKITKHPFVLIMNDLIQLV